MGEGPLAVERDLLVAGLAHQLVGHLLEGVAGHHVDAALLADDQVAGVAEQGPERRRQGEAALVVELSFVDPDEHRDNDRTFLGSRSAASLGTRAIPTEPHFGPRFPPLSTTLPH